MVYVALLRGINVGGNNKVDMKRLKAALEYAGFNHVSTYINSGNIFFADSSKSPAGLTEQFEQVISDTFGLGIRVLLRDLVNIERVVNALPDEWKNNADAKSDVMFLWDNYDNKHTLDKIGVKPAIETLRYVKGALLWHIERKDYSKSNLSKIAGTDLYKHMTIRNCNTARKLLERMRQTAEEAS